MTFLKMTRHHPTVGVAVSVSPGPGQLTDGAGRGPGPSHRAEAGACVATHVRVGEWTHHALLGPCTHAGAYCQTSPGPRTI